MSVFVCLKLWCATDEMGKLWSVEYELMEEVYLQGVEERGIDPRHEILQIFADAKKYEMSESREDGVCGGMRMSAFPVRAR